MNSSGFSKTLYMWALQPGTFQFEMFITWEVTQFWFVFLPYRSFMVYRAARSHKKHGQKNQYRVFAVVFHIV